MSRRQQAEGYSPRKHGQKCDRSCGSTVTIEVQVGGEESTCSRGRPTVRIPLPASFLSTNPTTVTKAHSGLQDIVENKMDMVSVLIQLGDD